MLTIDDLTYRIGGRVLFDRASVTVPGGRKVGLVGRNGTGKSTLLDLIAGELQADGGSISLPTRIRMGSVAQEMPDGSLTPLEFVLAADRERTALLAEAETATDPVRIADIHTRLVDIRAEAAPARAASILSGLGFDEAAQGRPLASFSGGWRMRVALGATLFTEPDLLLLDEPSNHLDLETRIWLESHLSSLSSTLLLVSHDRDLLNGVVDGIVHLEGGKLSWYQGDYDRFERTRAERTAARQAEYEKQQEQRKHMQAFVDRFRAKASKARQAQSRLKALERLPDLAPVLAEAKMTFDFPNPEPLPSPLLTLDRAGVGYGDGALVLRDLNMTISSEDRIALLGANGNGKTTFLKLIEGTLRASAGEVRRSGKLKVGYFEQEQADAFDLERTPFQLMSSILPDLLEPKVRAHLGRFGFPQNKADVRIGALSGGEKARLLFACVTRHAPHVLLLDEPTNHLDVEAREALIASINEWSGAVILVTHDTHLVELCADRLWLVADGTCRAFDGDVADYRRHILEVRRAERRRARDDKAREEADAPGSRRDNRRARAEARAALSDQRRAARAAERRMEQLGAEKRTLLERLADPSFYAKGGDVPATQARLAAVERSLAEAEAAWLSAEEAMQQADADA